MNETWKSGLYLVFPIYLLSIVVVIILLSHNSTWLSNKTSRFSVQVLITIVHISFSNLLIATVNVIVPLKIYMDKEEEVIEQLVWINNGNVQFGSADHILLVTITLVTVHECFFYSILDFTNWRKIFYPIIIWRQISTSSI